MVILDKRSKLKVCINVSNLQDDEIENRDKFGQRVIPEIGFYMKYLEQGNDDCNRTQMGVLIKGEMMEIIKECDQDEEAGIINSFDKFSSSNFKVCFYEKSQE